MALHLLDKFFAAKKTMPVEEKPSRIKVVIAAFEDSCALNSGKALQYFLEKFPQLDVSYDDEIDDKAFLNLQSRHFFDLIDAGTHILKKNKADILIWGIREQNRIRLNFQTYKQYDSSVFPSFSLLNSLYLPVAYFQGAAFPNSILALIYGAVSAAAEVKPEKRKKQLLQEAVDMLNRQRSPQDLKIEFRPYIINLLALLYLHSAAGEIGKESVKTIKGLLETALKNNSNAKDGILLANIWFNLGQLYQVWAGRSAFSKFNCLKKAAECYRTAQKYFNRYAFPYDFGLTAYRLSTVYFEYWKQVSDVQALRDAVFQLREAEKIFSHISFPHFWAQIQGDLGFYLSMLGLFSHNDEISMLAVENYKSRQRVYTRELKPLDWAKTQENIGNIFYNGGKQLNDAEYLEEAVKYYDDAAEIYENHKMANEYRQIKNCTAKAEELIFKVQHK